jgi:hypothetical protein
MIQSPLKNPNSPKKCLKQLLEIIPAGSIVDTFLLFSGDVEINLAEYDRFVIAHTNKYAIYEFWWSVQRESDRMYKIVTCDQFKFHPTMYEIMQRRWVEFKDPIVRSAIFFTLNQMSETGNVSSGKLIGNSFNPVALGNLRAFKASDNIHFVLDKGEDFMQSLDSELRGDYAVVFAGKFNYNLFDYGKSQSYDTYTVDHRKLKDLFESSNKKLMLIYNFDNRVDKFFKKHKKILIDKYGRTTDNKEEAVEVIIANF